MTNQEAFDIIVKGLREQGRPSTNAHGMCMYRGRDGTKCAVGMLIPDDQYSEEMEGRAVWAVRVNSAPVLRGLDEALLDEAQQIHDNWEEGRPFPEREFRHLAFRSRLIYPEPNEAANA